jgi:hypothetical protein
MAGSSENNNISWGPVKGEELLAWRSYLVIELFELCVRISSTIRFSMNIWFREVCCGEKDLRCLLL